MMRGGWRSGRECEAGSRKADVDVCWPECAGQERRLAQRLERVTFEVPKRHRYGAAGLVCSVAASSGRAAQQARRNSGMWQGGGGWAKGQGCEVGGQVGSACQAQRLQGGWRMKPRRREQVCGHGCGTTRQTGGAARRFKQGSVVDAARRLAQRQGVHGMSSNAVAGVCWLECEGQEGRRAQRLEKVKLLVPKRHRYGAAGLSVA